MTEERYRVGAMTVALTVEHGVPVEAECECEEYARLESHPMISGPDERCKHIREAEMYHHFKRRVSPVEPSD